MGEVQRLHLVPEALTRALVGLADAVEKERTGLRQRFAGVIDLDGEPLPKRKGAPEIVN